MNEGDEHHDSAALADASLAALISRGHTLAVAESLTGGLLCDAHVRIPGASRALVGGVVAYSAQAKAQVLGVPRDLLDRHGTVSAPTAEAMACGVRLALGAQWGVSTTGVAGPEPSEGHPVGTAFVAVSGLSGGEELVLVRALTLSGEDREAIRRSCVLQAQRLLSEALAGSVEDTGVGPAV